MVSEHHARARKVLLVSSNGGGLGHLSRQVAIALAGAKNKNLDARILTMSKGADLARNLGPEVEYFPTRTVNGMSVSEWEFSLANTIVRLVRQHDLEVVHFDGVYVYGGIILAADRLPNVSFAWTRRGMWKARSKSRGLLVSRMFDLIIQPGDHAQTSDVGPTAARTDATNVPPFTLLEAIPVLSREDAVAQIGLNPEKKTMLVAIGSGALGDTDAIKHAVYESIEQSDGWQAVTTTSPIASGAGNSRTGVHQLPISYPIVPYLNAIDAAVVAAGYNAPHEMVDAGIPSLLIPNHATLMDDQLARSVCFASRGIAVMAASEKTAEIVDQLQVLMSDAGNAGIKDKIERMAPAEKHGGASAAAHLLSKLLPEKKRRNYRRFWATIIVMRLTALSVLDRIRRVSQVPTKS
jgi:UDP-N-acetylglucosamine:LPS N-acetylglucosamine transferase